MHNRNPAPDLIDSARAEKEANLTPEKPPKAERRLESIRTAALSHADWRRRRFRRSRLAEFYRLGLRHRPAIHAQRSVGWQTHGQHRIPRRDESILPGPLDLALPHLLDDRVISEFQRKSIGTSRKCRTTAAGRSRGRPGAAITGWKIRTWSCVPACASTKACRPARSAHSWRSTSGPGHSTQYISSEQQFSPAVAPGIDRQTNFWRGGGAGRVRLARTDHPIRPAAASIRRNMSVTWITDLGRYSFLRLDLDASQYIPLFNRTQVIALHGASSLTTTRHAIRLFRSISSRLLADPTRCAAIASTASTATTRPSSTPSTVGASPLIQMVAFADGGKVFNRWEQWNFHDIQSDVGFGLRFRGRSKVAFSFETGFSHEGFQIWFRVNNGS